MTLAKTEGVSTVGQIPSSIGPPQVLFRAETMQLELVEPSDLRQAATFLNVDYAQSVKDALDSFCSVIATGFVDWTAEVIVGSFREDIERDPMVHRSGFDLDSLCDPILKEDAVQFFVRCANDEEERIVFVSLNLTSSTLDFSIRASWPTRRIKYVADDGETLRMS